MIVCAFMSSRSLLVPLEDEIMIQKTKAQLILPFLGSRKGLLINSVQWVLSNLIASRKPRSFLNTTFTFEFPLRKFKTLEEMVARRLNTPDGDWNFQISTAARKSASVQFAGFVVMTCDAKAVARLTTPTKPTARSCYRSMSDLTLTFRFNLDWPEQPDLNNLTWTFPGLKFWLKFLIWQFSALKYLQRLSSCGATKSYHAHMH